MSTQIAVRLPDELVAYLDAQVAAGASSRAAVVRDALEDLRRHRVAERDAEILRRTGDYEDFAGLTTPLDLTDLADLD